MSTELYVYDPDTMLHIATIVGADNSACEAKANDTYGPDMYGWTYSPAFGANDGLVSNEDAVELNA